MMITRRIRAHVHAELATPPFLGLPPLRAVAKIPVGLVYGNQSCCSCKNRAGIGLAMSGRKALQTALLICSIVFLLLPPSHGFQNCSLTVRVDPSSEDGGNPPPVGGTFSDLQDALLNISRRETVSEDCINVEVAEGDYVITDFISISRQSLSLQGAGNVTVRFNFTGEFDPRTTTQPHYVLSFSNADYVRLNGLDFTDSPGIITILNVTTALVENCSFR